MTIEVVDDLKNANLDYSLRGDAPPAVTLVELALCIDGSFTECSGVDYERGDLTADLSVAADGETTDSFDFDVNAETATHFQILHDNVAKIQGSLLEPKTGAFTLDFDALLRATDI